MFVKRYAADSGMEKKISPEGPADMERPAAAIMLAVRDSMRRTSGPKGKEKY